MSYTYQLQSLGESVKRSDGTFIPFDPANTDYQAFLLWKSQGNEPLPADDPQP
jgi:hypothetical protein